MNRCACCANIHLNTDKTAQLSIEIFFFCSFKRHSASSLYLCVSLAQFVSSESILPSRLCHVRCVCVWNCSIQLHNKLTVSWMVHEWKKKHMSKILFNSQRQPISITVIYCCCYRIQCYRIEISATKCLTLRMCRKLNCLMLKWSERVLFGLAFYSLHCCCCYVRSAIQTKMLISLWYNKSVGYVQKHILFHLK